VHGWLDMTDRVPAAAREQDRVPGAFDDLRRRTRGLS
jgi:hypothetical protein